MKKWIAIIAAAISLAGCKEENNLINFSPTPPKSSEDSTYVMQTVPPAQSRNILIEDMTGDQCVNCPNAALTGEYLKDSFPGRIFIIAEHTGSLADPYKQEKHNFHCADADRMLSFLGTPTGYPQGIVDRQIFPGKGLQVQYSDWPGLVHTEIDSATPVNITFNKKSYNASTGKMNVTVQSVFTQAHQGTFYLTVALLESGMIDLQKSPYATTPGGVDSNYTFNNVLRQTVTAYNGVQLGSNPEKGRTYVTNLSATLNPAWVADSCSIVAFVHYRGNSPTDNQKVFQVTGTTLTK